MSLQAYKFIRDFGSVGSHLSDGGGAQYRGDEVRPGVA